MGDNAVTRAPGVRENRARRAGMQRVLALVAALLAGGAFAHGEPRHAIAMQGEPALPADFAHFPYVNPAAPKGGRFTQGILGSFDSLNPFIVKGLPPQGMRAPLVPGTTSSPIPWSKA